MIPDATVTLKSAQRGDTRTILTGDQGSYHFTFLTPDVYTVSAATSALKSEMVQVTVEVGQAVAVDLVAQIQARKEVVEVRTEISLVATEDANLTTTFNSRQIQDLPMPGGDLTTVAFTVPGVVMSTGGNPLSGNFSSHGLPGISNLFTINGTDYNYPFLNVSMSGASNLLLGQTEIQEASVVQNGYSVQYGRQAGANVNFVTKSGSNAVHADLLYNFNNYLMNTNDFFVNATGTPRPYSVSQEWGADIGGAAIRNRLFWYVDSEGLYYSFPTRGVVAIPSQPLQAYILSNLKPIQQPLYQAAFRLWNGAPGFSRAVPVTNGPGLLQDSQGLMGCGELAANNVAAPGGGIFGQNVSCLNAWGTTGTNTNREWLNTARADWNIDTDQRIFFRFKGDHGIQPTATNLISPILNVQSPQTSYEGQINHTYVISGTMVNNLIASVYWNSAIFAPPDTAKAAAAFPADFNIMGQAGANGGGIYPMGVQWSTFPQGANVAQGQLIDDLSVSRGSHSFKIGLNFRRNRMTNLGYQTGRIGSYYFSNIVDFANGVTNPSDYSSYYQAFYPLESVHDRTYTLGVYGMDEWNIRPKLKLTLGIRLDRTPNPTCVDHCYSRLTDQFSSSSFQKGASIPYDSSIQTGLSQPYYSVDPVVPNPRLALAWTPTKATGTVLRSGVGLFSDLPLGYLASQLSYNAPYPYQAYIFQGQEVGPASDPNSAAAAALIQFNAFKSGFFSGQTLNQLINSVPNGGFSAPGYTSIGHHFATPQYAEWSLEIEQPLGTGNVFAATYSGNYGFNLVIQNGLVNAFLSNPQQFPNGFGGLPLSAPDPRFAAVNEITNGGMSRYDGLSLQFRRALRWGFQGQISYTWSHALDDVSNGGAFGFTNASLTGLSSPSVRENYSNADYDVRHNLLADFLWVTPWKLRNRALDEALNHWTVGGKFFLRSGSPYSIIDSALGGNLSPNIGAALLATYAVSNGVARHCGASAVNTPCYSLSDFVTTLQETGFGNVARNSFYGPGYFDIDATLLKTFPVQERLKFSVGAEAFNLMNHPHFANPNGDIAGGGFGTITGTVGQPTSPYGAFAGSAVSGRVLVITGRFTF